MITTATGLILLLGGCLIGWSLRWSQVDALQRRNEQLLIDLDGAVRDISVMLGRRNHPAGRQLRAVPEQRR